MKTNPNHAINPETHSNESGAQWLEGGLTKREYFAAIAMQGLLASGMPIKKQDGGGTAYDVAEYSKKAVEVSDALIAELNK